MNSNNSNNINSIVISIPTIRDDEPDFEVADYESSTKTTTMITYEDAEKLAEDNYGLVHKLTQTYFDKAAPFAHKEYTDLEAVAMHGYVKAINTFDPSLGNKFSTYAYTCIDNEIKYYLRSENQVTRQTISMNATISVDNNGKEQNIEDVLGASDEDVAANFAHENLIEIMLRVINYDLDDEDRTIIKARFGIDGDTFTQSEVAKFVDMSQANVSKREKSILTKIKKIMSVKYNIAEYY